MSCPDGSCREPAKRSRALLMLGLMMLVFIALSGISFVKSRNQVTPDTVSFGTHNAIDGKRVFQAYNCMGCHTMVGNGAYFAPDLTKEYASAGPAWLAAFLPSAGGWPTEGALKAQLQNKDILTDAGVGTIADYYAKYPGAKERVDRRGGHSTYMPNLPFTSEEVGQLIAFMKYTSAMNTEAWPPEVKTGSLEKRLELAHGPSPVAAAPAAATAAPVMTPTAQGEKLVTDLGCLACHSKEDKRLVGPGWKGLFGSQVKLDDGTTVTADDAYLTGSILHPSDQTVESYPKGTMPVYDKMLMPEDVKSIVAYIQTLK